MTRRLMIGFDRRIDIEWLDAAAAKVARDGPTPELREYLFDLLDGAVAGEGPRSARGKTVTVLSRIWGNVPDPAVRMRNEATEYLSNALPDERLALHWAMMIASYPIFTDVATVTGKLLSIQESFSLEQLSTRLVADWGERSTLLRAVQRIVRSMVQWGVLIDTDIRGVYQQPRAVRSVSPTVALLLVEALLIDTEYEGSEFKRLVNHPAVFPFDLPLSAADLRKVEHFHVHRQGLDEDFVQLVEFDY